jgi:hypothetical protein
MTDRFGGKRSAQRAARLAKAWRSRSEERSAQRAARLAKAWRSRSEERSGVRSEERPAARIALHAACAAAALLGAACVGPQLDPGGERVQVREADQLVAPCQKIGVATANTLGRFIFRRSDEKIASELVVLGRNQAARIGGDAIAPNPPVVRGEQTFDVYRCSVS